MFCFWLIFKKGKKNLILNIVIEKQPGEAAFIENAFENLLRTFFYFLIKDAGQYFIAFLSLCILIKFWNIKD